MKYDYRKAMTEDIKNYIIDNYMEPAPDMTRDEYVEVLNDELWGVDIITGNGGFYYASEEECANYVGYGLHEFVEALDEWGRDSISKNWKEFYAAPARYVDCIIRTYLLGECIDEAIDELGYFKED